MNIVVCLARVPDTASRLRIAPDGRSVAADGVQYVISPYDEFALEAALQFKEARGGELTVMHVGAADFQKDLRQCLAKGADRALQLSVDGPLGPASIASLLADQIRPLLPAMVFCGKQAVDSDQGATGVFLAVALDLPVVTKVSQLAYEGEHLVATREIEGAREVVQATLPCVVTCEKGLNEPRRAGLKEIMAAKNKPLVVQPVTRPAARLEVHALALPPERAAGRIVGEGVGAVPALIDALEREAKVL